MKAEMNLTGEQTVNLFNRAIKTGLNVALHIKHDSANIYTVTVDGGINAVTVLLAREFVPEITK